MKINKNDIQNIINKSLHGGGNYSELEIALAKKCQSLYEAVSSINAERSIFFDALYSVDCTIHKAAGDCLKKKKISDIEGQEKYAISLLEKLKKEKGEIDGSNPVQDVHAQANTEDAGSIPR